MHDHVARADRVPARCERAQHVRYVAWDRALLQRRRLRAFGKPAAPFVHQRCTEILRLGGDRRLGHAHELVADFDSDVLERALDHRSRNRVDRWMNLSVHVRLRA